MAEDEPDRADIIMKIINTSFYCHYDATEA